MKELEIERNTDRSRILFLLLSIVSALLYVQSEGSTLFWILALVLIGTSKIEKAEHHLLRVAGVATYVIYFLWIGYKGFEWLFTNFIR
ncbi:hypothetical protein JCM9140_1567 [Halalkalibacter wakoensis JCM 9140]|uniref:Uncharacterized protein n=1 Tax=Halalkalibacter wakoensis JCM 9140 TaxID=1236970 RepID=W4Q0R3_9BACI|nr:hypothetical protein [Halalkalibacter wakoensis]GAE25567.1 hypothetical protein JCM9140_1567 [Halalkalibacter wakoensis JCM 9140]